MSLHPSSSLPTAASMSAAHGLMVATFGVDHSLQVAHYVGHVSGSTLDFTVSYTHAGSTQSEHYTAIRGDPYFVIAC